MWGCWVKWMRVLARLALGVLSADQESLVRMWAGSALCRHQLEPSGPFDRTPDRELAESGMKLDVM